jgi:type IV pilus assembly protein PilE
MTTTHLSARRRAAGFTLIETLAAVSIAGVLASIAYPTFEAPIQKARRTDALVALMQLQMAEERWRADHRSYATLAELGAASMSANRYYSLQVVSADEDGFALRATGTGLQARDQACRYLALRVSGANVVQASGPTADAVNPAAMNQRCWGL